MNIQGAALWLSIWLFNIADTQSFGDFVIGTLSLKEQKGAFKENRYLCGPTGWDYYEVVAPVLKMVLHNVKPASLSSTPRHRID